MCGTGDGVLNIFNWGEWGNISDRFPGHPMSVDCMVQITEDIICTGSIDGIIRLVSLYNLRDGIKSYGTFAIFTRLKIDLETPPPPSPYL